jgi:hypothetical protein
MKMMKMFALVISLCFLTLPVIAQQQPNASEDSELAYTRAITERAEKIVASLGLTNISQVEAVRDILVEQYRSLRSIHDGRDAKIKGAKEKAGDDKAAVEAAVTSAQTEAQAQLERRHEQFLSQLALQLTPEQVDLVKDGLTYNVVHVTYSAYLKMYPDLNDEHKSKIKAWLIEAREIAMDQGTAKEKHAVFGKYKGRINNYLSKEGFSAKKAEQNLKQ